MASQPREGIRARDLDDVIELATRRAEARADEVSIEEVERIAAELDISPAEVRAAIDELKRRRAAEAAAEGTRRAGDRIRRGRLKQIALAVGALLLLGALWTPISLGGKLSAVEQHRADIDNALERQRAVEARLAGRAPTPAVDAERAGADNRVRIARQRHDEAAAAYNRAAGRPPAMLFRGLFGYPATVPPSSEVAR